MTWERIAEIGSIVAAIVGALGALGGLLLWLVLPRVREWIQREVARPVQKIETQVTPNGGDPNGVLGDRVIHLQKVMLDHLAYHDERDRTET